MYWSHTISLFLDLLQYLFYLLIKKLQNILLFCNIGIIKILEAVNCSVYYAFFSEVFLNIFNSRYLHILEF